MSLEDYIREQERKLSKGAQGVKNQAKEAWTDTKKAVRNAKEDLLG